MGVVGVERAGRGQRVAAALHGRLSTASLLFLAVFTASFEAEAREPARAAWVGLAPGPLAAARSEELEALLAEALSASDSFRVVDAAGGALDERLFSADLARFKQLSDEGINLLLNLKQKKAIEKLDEAIKLFKSRLMQSGDHDPLRDALLAKAEALSQVGQLTAAKEVLRSLAILSPVHEPTKKTHPPKFVQLWEKARDELGPQGRLVVVRSPTSATVLIDGRSMPATSASPALLPAGPHTLTVHWPFVRVAQQIFVQSNRAQEIAIEPNGPAIAARTSVLEVVDRSKGLAEATRATARIAEVASAEEVWVATARGEPGSESLLLARHDANGALIAVARVPIAQGAGSEPMVTAVERLVAAVFSDTGSGELDVNARGETRAGRGIADLMYSGPTGEAGSVTARVEPPNALDEDEPQGDRPHKHMVQVPSPPLTPPSGSEPEERGITSSWWFWAGIGAAVLGAAVVGGTVLRRPDPKSTHIQVLLTRDGS